MDCINLRERFGKRYRLTFDPAYDPKGRPRDKLDPWMMVIEGQRSTIYPYGGCLLAVEVEGRAVTRRRLRELAGTTVIQDGDDFTAFTFDVGIYPAVAAIVRPRRRRILSEAQREQLRQLSSQHGFGAQRLHQPEHPRRAPTHDMAPT